MPVPRQSNHALRPPVPFVKEQIPETSLKGVGKGYTLYSVVRRRDLPGLRQTGATEEFMNTTYRVFTKEMEDAVRPAQ